MLEFALLRMGIAVKSGMTLVSASEPHPDDVDGEFGKVGAVEGALLDLDYRGSLDLVTVSPENLGVRVLRNLGNLYFSDCTATSGVPAALTGVRQLAVEDWNNDDVQDLLLARDGAAPLLLAKQRGGPLVPTNSPATWPARSTGPAPAAACTCG